MRWQHPRLGMVPPSVFIEVAEQSGLIESLGRARAAKPPATTPRLGHRRGTKPFVSVNISPRQLRSGDLPEVVSHSLATSGLVPSSCTWS